MLAKITSLKDRSVHYRVFAIWYGSYTSGESWKLNSGITQVYQSEEYYEFLGSSGSSYHCNKKAYGTSGYGTGVLNNLIENSSEHVLIEPLYDIEDINTIPELLKPYLD
jgi:hypothetical protein